jgi:hypothetical protein
MARKITRLLRHSRMLGKTDSAVSKELCVIEEAIETVILSLKN